MRFVDEPTEVEAWIDTDGAPVPRAFTWRGRRYVVQAVEWAWRTPEGPHFVVRTEEGNTYDLTYDEVGDAWSLKEVTCKGM